MAQFTATRMHTPAMSIESGAFKPQQSLYSSTYSESSIFLSWNSEEDTDSDSEHSFYNDSFMGRRKPLTHRTKMNKFHVECVSRAAPVAIPARTHDFGWCDRDDERITSTTCPCGNDCDEFFQGELHSNASSPVSTSSQREADSDDFIFDMEM